MKIDLAISLLTWLNIRIEIGAKRGECISTIDTPRFKTNP